MNEKMLFEFQKEYFLLVHCLLQRRAAAGGKPIGGNALKDNVLNAALFAETTLVVARSVLVHHKNVGTNGIDSGSEIEETASAIDDGIVHIAYGLHHKEALVLGKHGFVMLQFHDCSITTDAHVEVAIGCCLTKELNVATMEQVVTPADKNFFGHKYQILPFYAACG